MNKNHFEVASNDKVRLLKVVKCEKLWLVLNETDPAMRVYVKAPVPRPTPGLMNEYELSNKHLEAWLWVQGITINKQMLMLLFSFYTAYQQYNMPHIKI
jgi:hypothetical protein